MAKKVAVRTKGESQDPFEGKEADVACKIEVWMEKKCAVDEGCCKREDVIRRGENRIFESG